MRLEWKSISVWSVIKVGFFVNLILGFLLGLLYAVLFIPFMAAMGDFMALEGMGGPNLTEVGVVGMMIIMPLMLAVMNAVFGTIFLAIAAMIFNLVVRIVGGIEYEVDIVNWGELSGLASGGGAPGYAYQGYPSQQPQPPSQPTGPYAAPPPSEQRPPEPKPPEQTVPQGKPPSQPLEGRPQAPTPPPPPQESPAGEPVEPIEPKDLDNNQDDENQRPQT